MEVDTSEVRQCDLLLLEGNEVEHLGLQIWCTLEDQSIMNVVNKCSKLISIDLKGYKKMTNAGITALAAGRCKLQSIDISYC